GGVKVDGADTSFLAESVVVPRVTLVGRDEVCLPADLERRNRIGLIHAQHGPVANVDCVVAIARVKSVIATVVVLVAERQDRRDDGWVRRQVDDGQRVVFLQGYEG